MVWHTVAAKAATTVVTGVIGAAAFDVLRKASTKLPVRKAAVNATALGLRGVRAAEANAERARLAIGDVVAEAREQIGEEAPAPVAGAAGHDH
ncbi:hypothetical protein B1R94_06000 [Mycolicibacterium litorale]|nr:hypothetical protein B1R94_06000 [Mycolicibacterium litorale]